jgi:hypothetical protein
MSVDLKAIENSVIMELSGKIRARVKGDAIAGELNIAIAQVAAEVVTLYLEEYLKATNQK